MIDYPPLPEALAQPKAATQTTREAQADVRERLPFADRRSFADAARGRLAGMTPVIVKRPNGHPVYDLSKFDFLEAEAPAEVNPSLWRQAQLNAQHSGLYEVVPGLYQVRSYDMANMTLIAGDTGWIIIDPLTAAEVSAAGLALANEHLGTRPVRAVIHTHSHIDHYGGVYGVASAEQIARGEVAIVAPEHFVDEALSENVLAGNVMGRRATYMYGNLLSPGPQGFVTNGLGATLALGSTGIAVPTDTVRTTGEVRSLDGVEFEFQMTPGTEAPAEFVFYIPRFKALCMSEITSHHLHNVYTPRGAQVRDALAWAEQIDESIERFGDRLEIEFASHHWPIWGREEAVEYLQKQRDMYKYIHDQTLRLANQGFNKEEIAEQISLPDSLGMEFYNRDYYGTVSHNSRAVYVKYLGFFDGNPANLNPLPPEAAAHRYVEYMGGADAICTRAQDSFAQGDYRWVAEVLNHVVMSDPEHLDARALLADTYEQLGYQAESGPWRNFYLCGALELRHGLPAGSRYRVSEGVAQGMPFENLFKLLAIQLLPDKVDGRSYAIDLRLTDAGEAWQMIVHNSVLHARRNSTATAGLTLTGPAPDIKRLLLGLTTLDALETIALTGEVQLLHDLLDARDYFPRRFPIVTPRGLTT
ncbi:MAG: alkyl sulfatase dimerization domain-containing protein [Pseudomonadota bacterium]